MTRARMVPAERAGQANAAGMKHALASLLVLVALLGGCAFDADTERQIQAQYQRALRR